MKRGRARVLLIADFGQYGGTKTYFFSLIGFLLKKQCCVTALLLDQNVLTGKEFDKLIKNGVEIKYIPSLVVTKKRRLIKFRLDKIIQLLLFIRLAFAGYNKVIVSTGNPFQFISGSLVFGNKFYYFLHTYPNIDYSYVQKPKIPLRKVFNKFLFIRKPNFITVSNESKKHIINFLWVQKYSNYIKVIHNASTYTYEGKNEFKSNNIITIGHLEKYKNPFFWLEVACYVVDRNNTAQFSWLGDGSLMEQIRKKIPQDKHFNIHILGYISRVDQILKNGIIYFQPSLIESHGISVIDAMVYSLPCVVSRRGGLPESVDDGITGFICELNVTEVGEKLLYLLNNKEKAKEMGVAGYNKFINEFSIPIWEEKIEKVLFSN